jgi:hypothetical protein
MEEDVRIGFCIVCGAEVENVELLGRGLHCDACNEEGVYGCQALLFMFQPAKTE